MIRHLNTQELCDEVTRLATLYPGTIYQQFCQKNTLLKDQEACCYTLGEAGENTGCIIGQAILNLRPEYKDLLSMFDKYMNEIGGVNCGIAAIGHMILSDYAHGSTQIGWLENVQSGQDTGRTWIKALEYANTYIYK